MNAPRYVLAHPGKGIFIGFAASGTPHWTIENFPPICGEGMVIVFASPGEARRYLRRIVPGYSRMSGDQRALYRTVPLYDWATYVNSEKQVQHFASLRGLVEVGLSDLLGGLLATAKPASRAIN